MKNATKITHHTVQPILFAGASFKSFLGILEYLSENINKIRNVI